MDEKMNEHKLITNVFIRKNFHRGRRLQNRNLKLVTF